MTQAIRAIYHEGNLRLLTPVDLSEGQEIQLLIVSETDQAEAVLADLLVNIPESDLDLDEAALVLEIEAGFHGQASLSEAIIQERYETNLN